MPGALSADNDLEAQDALTELNELVAQRDCVANMLWVADPAVGIPPTRLVAQLDVIGKLLPVDIVPGAASELNDLLAQEALVATNELVAHRDWVAQIAVFGTKLIEVATVAQLAVQGTSDAVATEFCLVPIRETIELLSQNEDVLDHEALIAQLDVIGNVEPVDIVPGAASANKDRLAQEAEMVVSELVAHND